MSEKTGFVPEGGLTKLEREELKKEYNVRNESLDALLKGGISPEDISEVLELRQHLSQIDRNGRIRSIASIKAMIELYQAAEGDIEVFEHLANRAHDAVETQMSKGGAVIELYTKAVKKVAKEYRQTGKLEE